MDENVVKKGLTFFVFGHDDGVDSGGTVSFTTRKCLVLSGNLCLDDFYVCFFIGNFFFIAFKINEYFIILLYLDFFCCLSTNVIYNVLFLQNINIFYSLNYISWELNFLWIIHSIEWCSFFFFQKISWCSFANKLTDFLLSGFVINRFNCVRCFKSTLFWACVIWFT